MNGRIFAALLAGLLPAHALDVSGVVQDKFENPLADVKVCVQGTAQCATSDAAGKFHLGGSSALRPVDPSLIKARLSFAGNRLSLLSPSTGEARLDWFDSRGARLGSVAGMSLIQGNNQVTLPSFLPRVGIAFLKVSAAGFEITWKMALSSTQGAALPAVAAAAKVSAASASLEASKDKYRTAVYAPASETESNAVIELRPAGDKILFDGKTTTGWVDRSNGSWKVVNGVLEETGGGGVLASNDNYGSFRLVFSSIKLPGSDHNPNILLWCKPGSTDTRTMGGIQFQPPLGHMWDYVKNKDPNGTTMKRVAPTTGLTPDAWNRCEALADQAKATIRFACCMLGDKKTCDATEIVDWTDPSYAKSGPIALMIHDGKQKQQYKDIEIEADPIQPDKLLSVKAK
jgi:hypothetical protein